MASPQKENGFIPISTELVDQFCRYRFSGEEWLVLWAVIRKTYGWQRKEDNISLSQLEALTGLPKPNIIRARSKLLSKKIIVISFDNKDNKPVAKYCIQKDYDKWEPLSKRQQLSKKITTVVKSDNKPLSKVIPTIDTIIDTNKDNLFTSFSNDVVMRWNSFCGEYPILSRVKELSPDRRKRLKQRYLRTSFRDFKGILSAITQQEFLLGRSKSGWKVNFDWLIANDTNYVKVLEFKYKQGGDSVPAELRKYIKS